MSDYSNPQRTLDLLAELEGLGFGDRAFAVIHHFRYPERIGSHRRYCEMLVEERAVFRTNSNRLVQRRLEMLVAMYKAARFASRAPEIFEYLARAALVEIPHDTRSRAEQAAAVRGADGA